MTAAFGRSPARARAAAGILSRERENDPEIIEGPDGLLLTLPSVQAPGTINVERLRPCTNLLRPICAALVRHARKAEIRTVRGRQRFFDCLKSGFLAFLHETGRERIAPSGVDRRLITAFVHWLSAPAPSGRVRGQRTRIASYRCLVQLLELWTRDGTCIAGVRADELPRAPERASRHQPGDAARGLTREQLEKVVRAAACEVRRTTARLEADHAIIDGPPPADPALAERREVLLAVLARPPALRSPSQLLKHDQALARRAERLGPDAVRVLFQPTLNETLSFIILFAVIFRMNESVVLGADMQDFSRRPWIGSDRIVASAFKARKHGRHVASAPAGDGDPTGPARMLRTMERWTRPIREALHSDRLFIHWNRNGARTHAFGGARGHAGKMSGAALAEPLKRFSDRHGLAPFTITGLRHALLDLAHEISGGDLLAVRAAGGQKTLRVVEDHYVSKAAMLRDDERLATIQSQIAREVATAGRFQTASTREAERGAVTPGWRCHRGAAPAFHADRADGACASYGRCPVCVHGRTDYASVECAADAVRLLDAVERSVAQMSPEAWLGQLAPIRMHLLGEVLPSFGEALLAEAEGLHLPQLPTLE